MGGGSATGGSGVPGVPRQALWVEVFANKTITTTTWPHANTTLNAAGALPTGTITVVSTAGFGFTTITPASNGTALPTGTINVVSTVGFPSAGTILVTTTAGAQTVTYTGITGTTFTGCTGGTGTMSTGNAVASPNGGKITVESDVGTQTISFTGITATTFTGCTGGTGAIAVGNLVRAIVKATIAAGSNNVALPTGTINVNSTYGFPSSGSLTIYTTAGFVTVAYTGNTPTTFTGCTGGSGNMLTGNLVVAITAQDLLQLNIVTSSSSNILSIFETCASNATNNSVVFFRLIYDGAVVRGGSTKSNGGNAATGTTIGNQQKNVAQGAHVLVIQWRVNSGTGQVRPNIAEDENASLLAQETS